MKALILALFVFAGIAGAYAQTSNTTGNTPNQNPSQSITPTPNGTQKDPGMRDDGMINNTAPNHKSSDPSKGGAVDPNYPNTTQSPEEAVPTENTTGTGDKKSTDPTTTTPTDLNKDKKKVK